VGNLQGQVNSVSLWLTNLFKLQCDFTGFWRKVEVTAWEPVVGVQRYQQNNHTQGPAPELELRMKWWPQRHFGCVLVSEIITWKHYLHQTPCALLQSGLQLVHSRSKEQTRIHWCTFSSGTCTLHMKSQSQSLSSAFLSVTIGFSVVQTLGLICLRSS
jgi:hypothetical protein